MSAQKAERPEERLVALRQDVLHDAEHAVGNLLQRLHHAARSAGGEVGGVGERLQGALGDLERLLELLFDYVTPFDLEVRPTEAGRVAESLAAQVRGQGAAVSIAAPVSIRVLADARSLSRSFQLVAQASVWPAGTSAIVSVAADGAADRVEFSLQVSGPAPAATPHAGLAYAVAGRLIELQGGDLQLGTGGACALRLPVSG